ncbi:MAG: hypothetical protein PHT41_04115 [Candidatus Omnitrophica bacterium]|nr:hypothetical protein [Candidatus Omnitrophota bacterium]MDD5238365.1 hypothetical protein [Candidatus Omnitrophota bacterium]
MKIIIQCSLIISRVNFNLNAEYKISLNLKMAGLAIMGGLNTNSPYTAK